MGDDAAASGGLMLAEPADSVDTAAMPDGGQARGGLPSAGDFGGHWPSKTEVTVTALLSSQSIELTVVAHNTGDVAEPIGIGWHPRFAVRGGKPGTVAAAGSRRDAGGGARSGRRASPAGALLPVTGTAYDFTAH